MLSNRASSDSRVSRWLTALGLWVLLTATAFAQADTGSIKVSVTIAGTAKPVEGVQLRMSGPEDPTKPDYGNLPTTSDDLLAYLVELAMARGIAVDNLSVHIGHGSEGPKTVPTMMCEAESKPLAPTAPPIAVTDAAGIAVIQSLAPGRYSVTASREGYVGVTTTTKTTRPVAHPSASSFITVKSAEEAQVSLIVNPVATIAGKVLDAGGKPVPGACVMAGVANRDKSGLSFVLGPRGFADSDGAYRLQVAPGEYVVRVKPAMKFSTFFYYAGGTDLEKATIVPIEAGGQVVGIDINFP